MKKSMKVMAAGLCALLVLAGCGDKGQTADKGAEDYSSYVTLGQYKGVEIPAVPDVTEEELEAELAGRFRAVVEEGDTVNIDFTGMKDGVAFEGGTAQGQSLTIGSGSYIDGFEDGLIGVNVGDTVDLNLTFPETYEPDPSMAGQAVVFTVTVNSIKGIVGPEMTDEVIAANTSYATVEEYKESVREEFQLAKDNERLEAIWAIVQANTQISGYPEELVKEYADSMKSYYEGMAAMYGIDMATLLAANNMTEEQFNQDCTQYGQDEAAKYMTLEMIAQTESIAISDEEFEQELAEVLEQSTMEREALLEYYGGEEQVRESLLYNKVLEFLLEQAVQV